MGFAPKLVVKFMNLFGYAPIDSGIQDIEYAANYQEGIAYPIAVTAVFMWKGVATPSLGHQPPNFDDIQHVIDAFDDNIYGSLKVLMLGIKESLGGNIQGGIDLVNKAYPILRKLGKAYLIIHIINTLNYAWVLPCHVPMSNNFFRKLEPWVTGTTLFPTWASPRKRRNWRNSTLPESVTFMHSFCRWREKNSKWKASKTSN